MQKFECVYSKRHSELKVCFYLFAYSGPGSEVTIINVVTAIRKALTRPVLHLMWCKRNMAFTQAVNEIFRSHVREAK